MRLQPFAFCPGAADLTDRLPILRGIVNRARGSVEAQGTLEWDTDHARGRVDIALRDVNATAAGFEIEHLYAAVTLLESGTPPGQLLSIGRIGFGRRIFSRGGRIRICRCFWQVWRRPGIGRCVHRCVLDSAQRYSVEFNTRK